MMIKELTPKQPTDGFVKFYQLDEDAIDRLLLYLKPLAQNLIDRLSKIEHVKILDYHYNHDEFRVAIDYGEGLRWVALTYLAAYRDMMGWDGHGFNSQMFIANTATVLERYSEGIDE